MGWIWTDELAEVVGDETGIPRSVVDRWRSTPFAVVAPPDADPVPLARRVAAVDGREARHPAKSDGDDGAGRPAD